MDIVIELVLTIIFDVVLGGRYGSRGRRGRRNRGSSRLSWIIIAALFLCLLCFCLFSLVVGGGSSTITLTTTP
jgi:hypothetical protein